MMFIKIRNLNEFVSHNRKLKYNAYTYYTYYNISQAFLISDFSKTVLYDPLVKNNHTQPYNILLYSFRENPYGILERILCRHLLLYTYAYRE
jgi:hypothetical protein